MKISIFTYSLPFLLFFSCFSLPIARAVSNPVSSPVDAVFAALAPDFQGRCVRVLTGDTLQVALWPRGRVTVQLAGIAAPRPDQPFGEDARSALASVVLDQKVAVVRKFTDRAGVVHGLVYAEADPRTPLSAVMVRSGLAWSDPRSSLLTGLDEVQRRARTLRRGLWADPNAIAPWAWTPPPPESQIEPEPAETPVPERVAGSIERMVGQPLDGDPILLQHVLDSRAFWDWQEANQRYNEFVLRYLWDYTDPLSFWNPWWIDNYGYWNYDAGYNTYGPGYMIHNEIPVQGLYGAPLGLPGFPGGFGY